MPGPARIRGLATRGGLGAAPDQPRARADGALVSGPVPPPAGAPAGAAPGGAPDVVLLAVTYDSAAIVPEFLRALPAALAGIDSARVVVVDNASTDGTAGLVRTIAPWAEVVEAGANLGYGAAINLGLRHARPRRGAYILNPDAVPSPGSVLTLLRAVEADPRIGMAVPRILTDAGDLKYSLRREPTLLRALGEALLGGRRAAAFAPLGDLIRDPAYYVDGASADWATGAAMFVPAHAARTVGTWDERFFLYSEETDYALRLRDAGLRVHLVHAASVAHPGGEMSSSPWLWSLVAVNRTRLYSKRHGRLAAGAYWLVVLGNESVRSLLGRPTHRAAAIALVRGHPALRERGLTGLSRRRARVPATPRPGADSR
ncbi:glycosyltransferase [Pseudactinotalea sp. HY160]|nr:glycosyltransferase [Pseudactinotalea sp. HY160]